MRGCLSSHLSCYCKIACCELLGSDTGWCSEIFAGGPSPGSTGFPKSPFADTFRNELDLQARDLAALACVSRDVRCAACSDTVWESLFVAEFGAPSPADGLRPGTGAFMAAFGARWAERERRRRQRRCTRVLHLLCGRMLHDPIISVPIYPAWAKSMLVLLQPQWLPRRLFLSGPTLALSFMPALALSLLHTCSLHIIALLDNYRPSSSSVAEMMKCVLLQADVARPKIALSGLRAAPGGAAPILPVRNRGWRLRPPAAAISGLFRVAWQRQRWQRAFWGSRVWLFCITPTPLVGALLIWAL